jgi:hypothetical protein
VFSQQSGKMIVAQTLVGPHPFTPEKIQHWKLLLEACASFSISHIVVVALWAINRADRSY